MIHVLLRGVRATQGDLVEYGGVALGVLGLATPDRFVDADLEPGDLYAVAMVEEASISEVLATLRREPAVIDAMSDERDSRSTRRRRKI